MTCVQAWKALPFYGPGIVKKTPVLPSVGLQSTPQKRLPQPHRHCLVQPYEVTA